MKRNAVMRVVLQIMLVLGILGLTSMVWALKGGPDKFGYRYIDSSDFSGPDSSWEQDVSEDNEVNVTDESNGLSIKMKIGFPFNFYGVDYEYLYVAGNGYLTFTPGEWGVDYMANHTYNGESVPSSGVPNNIIAPFWGKLDVKG